MRVKERTPDTLVIEEDPATWILVAGFLLVIGAVFALLGWTKDNWLFYLVGIVCLIGGPSAWLFAPMITHRFERARKTVTIEVKRRWKSERRELPFDDIADIFLEEVRISQRSGFSYFVYYRTTQGEAIKWCGSFDGSKENTVECFDAGRAFLGMAPAGAIRSPKIT